ncbi:HAD family hydrolase [Agromyces archimandritae]|nr:HAD-IA family hydrolase [Agromyces archimandritae]
MHAWSRLFTPFLAARGAAPYTDDDYYACIDGKPRYDGVRALLASRGIVLPEGDGSSGADAASTAPPASTAPKDTARENTEDTDTVRALGDRKNALFTETLDEEGVTAYPGSVAFLDAVQAAGCRVAVVSSSKNAPAVLEAAGIADRFPVVVDGAVASAQHLPGKPAPDTFLRAAELIGLPPAACAVVEDAESGVQAGAAGGFGIVIGVDRGVGAARLAELGAELVVKDLADLVPAVRGSEIVPADAGAELDALQGKEHPR